MKEEGSESKRKLYFNGEQKKLNRLKIHQLPSFSDALQLIKSQTTKPYPKIPLGTNTSFIFQYMENSMKKTVYLRFDLKNDFIYIKEANNQADHHVLSHFLLKDGNRVMYMSHHPNCPEMEKIKNQLINILEIKRIEDW
ncbi:hypothetical protein KDN24_14235 [Bacillus sp. Bva_UNVM-123]|uniref:hypothetical protein n=1 Tax=Bacillus sp. Bva_UNVM-123 TaxID=2829798 RepID=UPI00391F0E05